MNFEEAVQRLTELKSQVRCIDVLIEKCTVEDALDKEPGLDLVLDMLRNEQRNLADQIETLAKSEVVE